jgi:hypothetical protein
MVLPSRDQSCLVQAPPLWDYVLVVRGCGATSAGYGTCRDNGSPTGVERPVGADLLLCPLLQRLRGSKSLSWRIFARRRSCQHPRMRVSISESARSCRQQPEAVMRQSRCSVTTTMLNLNLQGPAGSPCQRKIRTSSILLWMNH